MPRTILVADPDVTTLELATAVLTRNGFHVECTNDGGDALARFFESSPCVVICDAELPVLSGVQLCRHIRDQGSDARVVLLRGSEHDDSCPHGCDAILDRPFRFGPLKELLVEWGLLEEETPDTGEEVAFGVPPAPALSGNEPEPEDVEIPADAIEATIEPEPTGARVVVRQILVARGLPGDDSEGPAPTPDAPEPEEVPPPTVEVSTPPAPDLAPTAEVSAPPAPDLAPSAEVSAPPAPDLAPAGQVPVPPAPDLGPQAVPAPEAPDLSAATPAATAEAHGDAPLPIPLPVPGAVEEEAGVELDRNRVNTSEAQRPTEGKGLPPSVPRVGTLAEVPLPRLLYELYVATYSGKLHLYRKGGKRSVFLWAGRPVFVDSDQLEERLGVLLRDEGRITQEQCDRGCEAAIERGVRMGEALIELGYISGSDLLEALEAQTEKKLVNTLAWREGSYKLQDDTGFVEGEVLTDVQPLKVIWRGVHEHYELSAMMTFFSKLRDRYVVTTDLFPVQFETLGPHLRDLSVATWLNGETTFEEALRSDDTRALEIAQALYVLLVTDMIRPSAEPGEPAPVIERKRGDGAPAAPVDYRFLMEVSDRIAKEYLRIKGKDYYTTLSIPRGASADAIEEAYRDAIEVARKDLKRAGLPHESLKRTREIIDLLTQAHSVLTSESERGPYDAGLADDEVSTEAQGTGRQKAFFDAEQAYREGVRLLEMLDARGARKQFEQALLGNPAEPTYRVAIAQAILVELKSEPARAHTEAFIYLEDALRLDPGNIPANLEAAQLFANQEMVSQARTHLERVLQRAPHHQKARRLLDSL